MSGLRWGIMGTGGIAATMAGTLRARGSDIVAVGSARPGAADSFARQWDIPRAVSSHAAVAEIDTVDVVYVASTNDRHYENVLAAVHNGKPALCEKPIAVNAAQGQDMLAAARDAGVFVMEAMWMRFQPFLTALDALINAGDIGDVRHIEAGLSISLSVDPNRRWLNRAMGGGALLDLGVYPLSLAHHLVGPPHAFEALARLGPTGVDLETLVISHHNNDVSASLSAGMLADGTNEAVIAGSEGRVRLHARFHQTQTMTLERRNGVVETIDCGYEGHGFQFEVAEVERCIGNGLVESPRRSHADTLSVLGWMDAVRQRCGIIFPEDG